MQFPSVEEALTDPSGLLAASETLTAQRLLVAYRQGIFPWFSEGQPVLWWSPDPRMVLYPDEFRCSHTLRRKLKRISLTEAHSEAHATRESPQWEVRCDTAFERVMNACAAPRPTQSGTWISPQIIASYCELHRAGFAHSIETWIGDELVGGLYGVTIGSMFFGESMFTRVNDASKIALAVLAGFLKQHGFPMIDCQQDTSHLASLGARPITRSSFVAQLSGLTNIPSRAKWPSGQRMSIRLALAAIDQDDVPTLSSIADH